MPSVFLTLAAVSVDILPGCQRFNYFRNMFQAERGWDLKNGAAGAIGCWGSTISTVEHMIKTQMQLDNIGNKRYTGSWHCIRTLVKERGWTVIYTGHVSLRHYHAFFRIIGMLILI